MHLTMRVCATDDPRKKWSKCIHGVRNQGKCGSCWAFALAGVLSDRYCTSSQGRTNVELSPQYLVSCDKTDKGCEGGSLDRSWKFAVSSGLCTERCWPYESQSGFVPKCMAKCVDGKEMHMYKARKWRQMKGMEAMMSEMEDYGVLEAGFNVYQASGRTVWQAVDAAD